MPFYNVLPHETHSLGIDCAARPFGQAVKDSPYSLICRYLSDGGPTLPGKQLHPDEASSYLEHDIALISNWETYANRMNEGYKAGKYDADKALAHHLYCGGPKNAVIYFSADWDVTEDEQTNVNEYLRGCIEVLGEEKVGIYGGYWVCKRAKNTYPGIHLWQTVAWSGGNREPRANIYQRVGYVYVENAQCDVNEILTPGDVGCWQEAMEDKECEKA